MKTEKEIQKDMEKIFNPFFSELHMKINMRFDELKRALNFVVEKKNKEITIFRDKVRALYEEDTIQFNDIIREWYSEEMKNQ